MPSSPGHEGSVQTCQSSQLSGLTLVAQMDSEPYMEVQRSLCRPQVVKGKTQSPHLARPAILVSLVRLRQEKRIKFILS